jgi:hypothetical protein
MFKKREAPTAADFKRARELAEELRRKLPQTPFTRKSRDPFSGKRRFILFVPDPQIVGRYRATFHDAPPDF